MNRVLLTTRSCCQPITEDSGWCALLPGRGFSARDSECRQGRGSNYREDALPVATQPLGDTGLAPQRTESKRPQVRGVQAHINIAGTQLGTRLSGNLCSNPWDQRPLALLCHNHNCSPLGSSLGALKLLPGEKAPEFSTTGHTTKAGPPKPPARQSHLQQHCSIIMKSADSSKEHLRTSLGVNKGLNQSLLSWVMLHIRQF